MSIKPFWGGTAYLIIVEIYQAGPVNYSMGGFKCDTFASGGQCNWAGGDWG